MNLRLKLTDKVYNDDLGLKQLISLRLKTQV